MSALITFLALNFVVFVHELGHFLAAKRAGIGVPEFSLGMGPLVFGKRFKGTLFSFRLLPLGGFVKLSGLDDEDCPPEKNYLNKTRSERALTLAAGSIMNILLGFVMLFFMTFFIGQVDVLPKVDNVREGTPAMAAGLQSQDTLVALNGTPIQHVQDDFITPLQSLVDTPSTITVKRADETLDIAITPALIDGRSMIGIELAISRSKYNPIQSIITAGKGTLFYGEMVFKSIHLLVTGTVSVKELSGPVGIVQIANNQFEQGLVQFFSIIVMISISLGVINLFPLPILDGGHLLFLGIEAIRNKPMNKSVERWINQIGIAFIIVLSIAIFVNDVRQWSEREIQLDAFNSGNYDNGSLND